MFLSLIKFFRGFLLVRLDGYSPERFLNLCSNHNILIWNLASRGACYEFNISIAGYRRLKPLLKKTKTRAVILSRTGLPFFLFRYRKRKVFFAGIALCMGLLIYLTTFIWLIDINGNSSITDDAILTFLASKHASFGSRKRSIDCAALEEALRTEYEDVIWASVRLSGTKLTVDIQESLIPKNADSAGQKKPEGAYHITAEKSAVIRSIITRNGTPLVKAGSRVKAGDILVSGRLDIYNDSGEIADCIYVAADADIFAQTQYAYEDVFPMEYSRKVRVGEGKSSYALNLFSYRIGFPSAFKKQELSLSYTESRQLAVAKDYYIPAVLEKTTYYKCGYEKVCLDEDGAKAKIEADLGQFLKKLEEKGIQITEKNVMIEFIEQKCHVSAMITAVEPIGRYEPVADSLEKERLTE